MASTTREAVIKALREEYMNRRGAAYEECDRRKQSLYPEIEGLWELDRELAMTSGKIMGAAMGGGDVDKQIAILKEQNAETRRKRGELLVANGYPADHLDIKFVCDKCRDTGFVGIDMCSCFKRELALAMLDASGLGRLAREQSFDNFKMDYYPAEAKAEMAHALDTVKRFAEGFGSGEAESLFLCGGTGLGKTHLSTAAAVEVVGKGYEVCYVSVQTMVDDFSDCQFRGEGRDSLRKYYDSDLLIIDDLGTELVNQFTVSSLYNVINTRLNNRKSMIISTNLSPDELLKKYDSRITSRILGGFIFLMFRGRDIRMQKLKEKR